jgi:membrane protein DedA with SNARE-associated domain
MHIVPAGWEPYLHEYGYWAVLAGLFMENLCLPVPGESLLLAAGALAGRGELPLAAVLAASWVGAVAGCCLGYAIGLQGGRRLVMRYGRYVLVTEKRLARAEGFFERYGGAVVVGARFIWGMRNVMGLVAGILKMPWGPFLAYNMAGAALWVGFWGVVAYELSRRAGWLEAHWTWVAGGLGILAAAVVGVIAHRRHGGNRPAQDVD